MKALPVVAEKNPIAPSYKDHILKHAAMLRNPLFQLSKAAEYLEQWVHGLLPPNSLLDVSAPGGSSWKSFSVVC